MENYIQKYKHGDAVFKVLSVDNLNRIIDVLVGIKGDGCLIEKPTNAEGRNWKIIVDDRQSDTPKEGANADPEEPKPLDYLIRFVGGNPRESQYGDWAAQTDFKVVQNASGEWLRDTLLPLGYCYLTFTQSGASTTTSARADNISTGFSIKAQRKKGAEDKLYRLLHGNQYAAMMRQGDNNSIQIDCKEYAQGPAYILREWNTDNNYITIPLANITSGAYAFLHYDTYLTPGKKLIEEPHEIKFATLNKAFFEDVVFFVSNIAKYVIDDELCGIVLGPILNVYQWHAMCRNYNREELPYAATPGTENFPDHGGWIHLDDIPGLGDFDDLQGLLAEVRAMYNRVFSSPVTDVETNIQAYQAITQRIDGIIDQIEAYGDELSAWNNDLDAALLTLQDAASELDGLEAYAADEEARVAALKRIIPT